MNGAAFVMPVGTVNVPVNCFHVPAVDEISAIQPYDVTLLAFVNSTSISLATVELYQTLYVYVVPAVTATDAGCHRASPVELEANVTDAPLVPALPLAGYVKVGVGVPQNVLVQLVGAVVPVSKPGF